MTVFGAPSLDSPLRDQTAHAYDALLLLSFGGPESPDDVLPFLKTVTRGRNIPPERLLEVADHYQHFGGVSPINAQNRALISSLEAEFAANDLDLPIYFGNRNWHPMVGDTIRQMRDEGVERALIFVTSAFSCWSGCRQYREDVIRAIEPLADSAWYSTKSAFFTTTPALSRRYAMACKPHSWQLGRMIEIELQSFSRRTVFRWPWPIAAPMSSSSMRPRRWS